MLHCKTGVCSCFRQTVLFLLGKNVRGSRVNWPTIARDEREWKPTVTAYWLCNDTDVACSETLFNPEPKLHLNISSDGRPTQAATVLHISVTRRLESFLVQRSSWTIRHQGETPWLILVRIQHWHQCWEPRLRHIYACNSIACHDQWSSGGTEVTIILATSICTRLQGVCC